MTGRGARSSDSARITRISAACVACRARKQKCSGERPQCAQCGINRVQCEWPQQQKRGPPKQYTSALERRLFETENLLVALLSQTTEHQLSSTLQQLEQLQVKGFGLVDVADDLDVLNYVRKHKSGPSYWDGHPLGSVEEIKGWCHDRAPATHENWLSTTGHSSADVEASRIEPGLESGGYGGEARSTMSINYGYAGEDPDVTFSSDREGPDVGMELEYGEDEEPSPNATGSTAKNNTARRTPADAGPGAPSNDYESAYLW